MTSLTLGAIVLDPVPGRARVALTDSLLEQVRRPDRIVVSDATEWTVPGIDVRESRPGLRLDNPGAIDRAIGVLDTEVWLALGAGWTMEPGFLAELGAVFEGDAALAVAGAGWVRTYHGERDERPLGRLDLPTALGVSDALPLPLAVRTGVWRELGGLDPALGAGALWDLWIRVLAQGLPGYVLPGVRLRHRAELDPAYRRSLERRQAMRRVRPVVEKHRALFERAAAEALVPREERLLAEWDRYRLVDARRREREAELARQLDRVLALRRQVDPPVGRLDFATLRRVLPVDRDWGYGRGKPVDRYYLEAFLRDHAADVRGVVLEVQEADYTRAFGGERVARADVVDIAPANPLATVVADLRQASEIPSDTYDCLVVCQTLHVIDEVQAALRECHRILKPGGVLLATFPCASRGCLEYGDDGDLWRVTEAGARHLVAEHFGPDGVEARAYGNVLATTAFLYGLAGDELDPAELDAHDPYHPTLVGVRARKPVRAGRPGPPRPAGRGLVLGYHRVAPPAGPDVHRLCTPPAVFAAHLAMLRTRFDVLALEELLARAGEGSLARDAVAITLDDGYRDALEVAVPLLAAAAVPVTLFVSTQADRGPYWWDVLEAVLLGGEELPGSLRIRLPQEVLELPTHDAAARRHAHDRLHGCLVPAPLAVRTHAMDQLVHQAGPAPAGPERLDPDQVAALARRPGVAIGSHGVHHLALTHVEEDAAWRELAESRRTLERLLGAPPAAICYAYGVAGRDAADLAAAAGYAWGLTRGPGMLERGVDRLLTPRVVTAGEAAAGLEARLVRVLDGCRSTDASR